jgi:hypothetical protein
MFACLATQVFFHRVGLMDPAVIVDHLNLEEQIQGQF